MKFRIRNILINKNTTSQIQLKKQFAERFSEIQDYYSMTNGGNSNIQEIDLSFRLRRTARIEETFNYTYIHASGTTSDELSNYSLLYRSFISDTVRINPTALYPLDFVPVHRLSIDLD